MAADSYVRLPGEGEVKLVKRTRVRLACDECGEPAVYRHTYLFDGVRRNPASSAFGKDDCSWCSDAQVLTCKDCVPATPTGCVENSRYEAGERFAHMFLCWQDEEVQGDGE